MNAISGTFGHQNSANTLSAISSPASGSGPTPYETQAGPITDQSGQVHARANLSARQVKELGSMMSGTFGLPSTTSLLSADRTSFLVSRLQAKAASLGSTLYKLTWKTRATPSGRSIPALRASVLRTSVKGSGGSERGWPTPIRADGRGSAGRGKTELPNTVKTAGWPTTTATDSTGAGSSGRKGGPNLQTAGRLAGWGTPLANHANGTPAQFLERKRQSAARTGRSMGISITDLNMQAQEWAGWPTTTARDGTRGSLPPRPQDTGIPLDQMAAMTTWPTPRASDGAKNVRTHKGAKAEILRKGTPQDLSMAAAITGPARLTATGELLTGSGARTGSGGQLSPEHSRWLMGLPAAWGCCGAMAMQSSSRKHGRSSKQSAKRLSKRNA